MDYAFGGFFALPGGVQFDGGTGGGDALVIRGTGATTFRYVSSGGSLGNARVESTEGSESNTIHFTGVEPLSITGALDVNVEGHLTSVPTP